MKNNVLINLSDGVVFLGLTRPYDDDEVVMTFYHNDYIIKVQHTDSHNAIVACYDFAKDKRLDTNLMEDKYGRKYKEFEYINSVCFFIKIVIAWIQNKND